MYALCMLPFSSDFQPIIHDSAGGLLMAKLDIAGNSDGDSEGDSDRWW